MKSNKFMVVQSISPISLIQQFHQTKPSSTHPHPLEISDELGKLEKGRESSVEMRKDDLFKSMRYFLIFGKLIGVVPISGIFSGDLHKLKFRKCNLSSLISLSVIIILICNTGVALVGYFQNGGRDATQLAKNAAASVCYSMGLFVFIFIFRNSERFITLVNKWREVDANCYRYYYEDPKLCFNINLIAGVILTSAILENAVSHLLLFPLEEHVANPLKHYYENSHKSWATMIPYSPVVAIGVFLCNKWAVYAWNFGDILIILISRGLYGRFKQFFKLVQGNLQRIGSGKPSCKRDWSDAIHHHDKLCKLTEEFASLLSSYVFVSFSVNIYFICIQLHLFLAPSKKIEFISSLYAGWSFLHLVFRTYAVALSAAKIHDYAHQFGKLLCDCPPDCYNVEVERAITKLSMHNVGLNGLGAFHISRKFLLSVISVIFTFEIVLLQTSQIIPSPSVDFDYVNGFGDKKS